MTRGWVGGWMAGWGVSVEIKDQPGWIKKAYETNITQYFRIKIHFYISSMITNHPFEIKINNILESVL